MPITVLINLMPIKKGGGQQVATNFVYHISKREDISAFYLVTKDTIIHRYLQKINVDKSKIIVVNPSLSSRFIFTFWKLKSLIKKYRIDLIYTMFGPGLHCKSTLSITGCAYSNLFFPEINFWEEYSFLQKIKLKIIDWYRLKTTLKSDAIIFENESMQDRAISLFAFPKEKTKLILPSITKTAPNDNYDINFNDRLRAIPNNDYNILMLTGWHKNKNIQIVPYVLEELHKKNIQNVNFVITVDPKDHRSLQLIEIAKKLNVQNNLILFDSVMPFEVPYLIQKVNALALFSKLESFSNNIIEAWSYKKTLFISDEEWSRSICKEYAIYVKRNDAKDISNKIEYIKNNIDIEQSLISKYEEILSMYPSPEEKVDLQVEFLKRMYNEKFN